MRRVPRKVLRQLAKPPLVRVRMEFRIGNRGIEVTTSPKVSGPPSSTKTVRPSGAHHPHDARRTVTIYYALTILGLFILKITGYCPGFAMTAMTKPQPMATAMERNEPLRKLYLETLSLIERLHRQLLDVIKDELDRRDEREINSVQALLLFNVGDQELTAGELRTRGHYLGSNVSYNLKKLVESGYIHHERSEADRRSVLVRLTRKGESVR